MSWLAVTNWALVRSMNGLLGSDNKSEASVTRFEEVDGKDGAIG
jgi:hypothetical protein